MLTQAPLPSWPDLFRGVTTGRPDRAELARPWQRSGESAGWLSRSAWSLALIALWRRRVRANTTLTAWVPDFFCNTTLDPLRELGVRFVFYPLTEQLAPDLSGAESAPPPDLFVLVHYFGRPSPGAAARQYCDRHGAWLIEDAAHVIKPIDGVGTIGDFVLYSPHKHLPIPDGAVLVIRREGPSRLSPGQVAGFGSPDGWPAQLSDLQRRLGESRAQGRRRRATWIAKRALQKLGVRGRHASVSYNEPVQPGPTLRQRIEEPAASEISLRILKGIGAEFGIAARHQHMKEWDDLVGRAGLAPAMRPAAAEWTPYLACYAVDPATASTTFSKLRGAGLPVVSWPDLPPEVTAGRDQHTEAWSRRHSRMYLPVHRSLIVPSEMSERSESRDG